jgi:hypothetical protein
MPSIAHTAPEDCWQWVNAGDQFALLEATVAISMLLR